MSISYANIAANKEDELPKVASPETLDPLESGSEPAAEPVAPAPTPLKEKKVLTPAPVPAQSVWGATPQAPLQPAKVDEHKWPTPDKGTSASTQPKSAKLIKQNKWVPINAKVVLPSPRPPVSSALKNKRKNKNTRKKIDKKDEDAQQDPEAASAAAAAAAPGLAVLGDSESDADADADAKRAAQKNYKKYHNGQAAQQSGRSSFAAPMRAQSGFYPSFVPQQYPRYKQSYSRLNSNGNVPVYGLPNGYAGTFVPLSQPPQQMMGMPYGPMPVQIPPPISPKQNPLQALTQQVDYYFSLDNLIRDVFLRKSMGTEGWVELDLILNFKRVKIIVNGLRNSIEEADEAVKESKLDKAILHAVQQCQNLEIGYLNGKEEHDAKATEVQLRVKHSFEQWLLPDN